MRPDTSPAGRGREPDPPGTGAVLVVGGTGFIGSAVVRELLTTGGTPSDPARPGHPGRDAVRLRAARSGPAREVRVLSRRPLPGWMESAGVRRVPGDLTEADSLRGCGDGVTTVLHLASYVGRDPARCEAVNATGTRALLGSTGPAHVVYVSTASVYGHGPHRGVPEGRLAPAPASAASASRLRAEQAVREHGGVVLRPNLVYGPGDRWFVPLLLRLLRKVPVWADGGRGRSSLVSVQELARVVAAFAGTEWTAADHGTVHHVNHPRPVTVRSVATRLSRTLGVPLPESDLPRPAHWELSSRVLPQLTAHQHALLTDDHYYESGRVWARLGIAPGPGFAAGLVTGLPWYRQHLAHTGAA